MESLSVFEQIVPVETFEEIPVYGGIDYRREVLVQVANEERTKRRSLLQILDEYGVGFMKSLLRLLKLRDDSPAVNSIDDIQDQQPVWSWQLKHGRLREVVIELLFKSLWFEWTYHKRLLFI